MNLDLNDIPLYVLKEIKTDKYELPERTLIQKYFGNSKNVLELGGAIGVVGIEAKQTYPHLKWISYEANPWCVERAKINYELNNIEPMVFQGVIGTRKGVSDFYIREEFWNCSLSSNQLSYSRIINKIQVPRYNIDSLNEYHEIIFDSFVVDIEGGEDFLFRKDLKFLKDIKKLVMEFHPQVYGIKNMNSLYMRILKLGFVRKDFINDVYYFIKE